jgi:hypothetical protein
LSINIAGSPVGEKLIVATLDIRALRPTRQNLHIAKEVRLRLATGSIVCLEAVIAGEVEQEAGFVVCAGGRLRQSEHSSG